jgi:hypothetical protein
MSYIQRLREIGISFRALEPASCRGCKYSPVNIQNHSQKRATSIGVLRLIQSSLFGNYPRRPSRLVINEITYGLARRPSMQYFDPLPSFKGLVIAVTKARFHISTGVAHPASQLHGYAEAGNSGGMSPARVTMSICKSLRALQGHCGVAALARHPVRVERDSCTCWHKIRSKHRSLR